MNNGAISIRLIWCKSQWTHLRFRESNMYTNHFDSAKYRGRRGRGGPLAHFAGRQMISNLDLYSSWLGFSSSRSLDSRIRAPPFRGGPTDLRFQNICASQSSESAFVMLFVRWTLWTVWTRPTNLSQSSTGFEHIFVFVIPCASGPLSCPATITVRSVARAVISLLRC